MVTLLSIALSTLLSEDLACVATGLLIAQGRLGFLQGAGACAIGIFAGDMLLVVAGRHGVALARRWPWFNQLQDREPVMNAIAWLRTRRFRVMLWTRFTPGLRLPTYLAAGLLRLPLLDVAPPLLLGSLVWTPILVGAAALLGTTFAWAALQTLHSMVLMVAFAAGIKWLGNFERSRKAMGALHRLLHWEFWPVWAVYLPLMPYLLWLAVRRRSLTLFMAANPGIPTGGLAGESKSAILQHLREDTDHSVPFRLFPAGVQQVQPVLEFMEREGLEFPVVAKPDQGERGRGVAILRSGAALADYLQSAGEPVIVQQYVDGVEFGLFYVRHPGWDRGRIVSITAKTFPHVTGDGHSSLEQLILRDSRAFCLHRTYLRASKKPPSWVPEAGERVQLVKIGSHCRGAVFLNAAFLKTELLESAVDRVSRLHPGFYFGRFDVRAESPEALARGEFKILELNGVGAEAAHIYDPSVSLWAAYRTLASQWRWAFEIGAGNRALGARPPSLLELLRLCRGNRAFVSGLRQISGRPPARAGRIAAA